MKNILDQFLEILKKEHISQYKIAKELNISQSYVNEILNGKKKPSINYLIKISEHLGYEIVLTKKNA